MSAGPDPHPDGARKTFLLGLGAQKTGTTWLHAALAAHPLCETGFRKEYHVLDVLCVPELAHFGEMNRAAIAAWEADPARSRKVDAHRRIVAFREDPALYFDYFARLGGPQTRVVADITPTYMAMPPAMLVKVRDAMAERGVATVPVFIMRDPVERVRSAARMALRNADLGPRPYKREAKLVRTRYATPEYALRTRYEHTLASLAAAGMREDAVILFYEEMFSAAAIAPLFARLGIDPGPLDFSERANATGPGRTVPEDLLDEVARFYGDTYRAVAAEFGTERVMRLWPNAARVLA